MTEMSRPCLRLTAIVLVLALVGCSGGGGGSSDDASQPGSSQWDDMRWDRDDWG